MNSAIELVYEVPDADARWVLEEDDNVPESALHDAIILLLTLVLKEWVRRTGRDAQVGRNLALRWNRANPRLGVDPDVYLVEPAPPNGDTLKSLCTWLPGHHPPRVAVEVVSENTGDKDYSDAPERYAASKTEELWVFDPLRAGPALRGGPFLLQVWRRDPHRRFRRVYAGEGPARSEALGAWLVACEGGSRLRVADDPEGTRLWPTESEAERAGREAAEAELATLRAELSRLRGE